MKLEAEKSIIIDIITETFSDCKIIIKNIMRPPMRSIIIGFIPISICIVAILLFNPNQTSDAIQINQTSDAIQINQTSDAIQINQTDNILQENPFVNNTCYYFVYELSQNQNFSNIEVTTNGFDCNLRIEK